MRLARGGATLPSPPPLRTQRNSLQDDFQQEYPSASTMRSHVMQAASPFLRDPSAEKTVYQPEQTSSQHSHLTIEPSTSGDKNPAWCAATSTPCLDQVTTECRFGSQSRWPATARRSSIYYPEKRWRESKGAGCGVEEPGRLGEWLAVASGGLPDLQRFCGI